MLAILSIIIGIVFVLLLFSLLTSATVELVHAILSSRGRHLRFTIESMLGDKADEFLKHPFFRQLSYAAGHRNVASHISPYSLPAWIHKGTFSNILADILRKESGDNLGQKIESIQDRELRVLLLYLHNQSGGNPAVFEQRVENWFEEVMERGKQWFGRATKWRLFGYGLLLAAAFNADTLQIYQSLSANAAVREELVKVAGAFAAGRDSVAAIDTTKTFEQAKMNVQEMRQTFVQSIQSPLGLGWYQSRPTNLEGWLIKLVGLLLTAVAVTVGAPFWFEMLKKLLALRSGGGTQVAVGTGTTGTGSQGLESMSIAPTRTSVFDFPPDEPGKTAKPGKSGKRDNIEAAG